MDARARAHILLRPRGDRREGERARADGWARLCQRSFRGTNSYTTDARCAARYCLGSLWRLLALPYAHWAELAGGRRILRSKSGAWDTSAARSGSGHTCGRLVVRIRRCDPVRGLHPDLGERDDERTRVCCCRSRHRRSVESQSCSAGRSALRPERSRNPAPADDGFDGLAVPDWMLALHGLLDLRRDRLATRRPHWRHACRIGFRVRTQEIKTPGTNIGAFVRRTGLEKS